MKLLTPALPNGALRSSVILRSLSLYWSCSILLACLILAKTTCSKWASAAFDMQGVQNQRGQAARGVIAEMRDFISKNATTDTLKPGSWTHRISEMTERGELDPELAPFTIRDYINPSLDTTISAIGHLMYHASFQPDIWEKNQQSACIGEQRRPRGSAYRDAHPIL